MISRLPLLSSCPLRKEVSLLFADPPKEGRLDCKVFRAGQEAVAVELGDGGKYKSAEQDLEVRNREARLRHVAAAADSIDVGQVITSAAAGREASVDGHYKWLAMIAFGS